MTEYFLFHKATFCTLWWWLNWWATLENAIYTDFLLLFIFRILELGQKRKRQQGQLTICDFSLFINTTLFMIVLYYFTCTYILFALNVYNWLKFILSMCLAYKQICIIPYS